MKKLIINYTIGALLLCATATLTSCGPTYQQRSSSYSSINKKEKVESKKSQKEIKKEARKSKKNR